MNNVICVTINPKPATRYNIFLGSGVFGTYKKWLPDSSLCSRIVIVTDKILEKFYAKNLVKDLNSLGYKTLLLTVNPGEESKSTSVKEMLELDMQKNKCDRKTLLIALGGGVIGDLVGFLAATYMRGVSFIQVPTTLLSAIDSSVGGKTGINTQYGKNLVGAIWQPIAVVTDITFFKTLPQMHLVNGLIEAIKIFITSVRESFSYLDKNLNKALKRDDKVLQSIIKRAVKLKAEVVAKDEREENLRMILNFGHTVGHAIERLSNYEILHGLCVALGMIVEAKIAVMLGHLEPEGFKQICLLLERIGINQEMLIKFSVDDMIENMLIDKKNSNGVIYMILVRQIGKVYTINGKVAVAIDKKIIKQAFVELGI